MGMEAVIAAGIWLRARSGCSGGRYLRWEVPLLRFLVVPGLLVAKIVSVWNWRERFMQVIGDVNQGATTRESVAAAAGSSPGSTRGGATTGGTETVFRCCLRLVTLNTGTVSSVGKNCCNHFISLGKGQADSCGVKLKTVGRLRH